MGMMDMIFLTFTQDSMDLLNTITNISNMAMTTSPISYLPYQSITTKPIMISISEVIGLIT